MPVDPSIVNADAVPYSVARKDIRNGDILLFHGDEPFSKVIQHFTHSPWSHVGFVWRLEDIDRVLVLESVDHFGVRMIPLSTRINGGAGVGGPYNGKMIVARHARFPQDAGEAFHQMTQFAIDRVGSPYSAMDLANVAMRIAAGLGGMKLPGELHPEGSYICSEYAHECFKRIGLEIAYDQEGFIAPADFANDPQVEAVFAISPDAPV